MKDLLISTDLPTYVGTLVMRGKVCDVYDLGVYGFLIVRTDRISVFDVVVGAVPRKGLVLNAISKYWFEKLKHVIGNHVISTDVADLPEYFGSYREVLEGRIMIVKKTRVLPIEAIVRGYIDGSAFKEYQKNGSFLDHDLPSGLVQCSRLLQPIFTPSTKAEAGLHDENITFKRMVEVLGDRNLAERVRDFSLQLYSEAYAIAEQKGILLIDTKFEFGLLPDGKLILVDEALTPDSSRYVAVADYKPGKAQKSQDKQPVRDYYESTGWNKKPPAPALPPEVAEATAERYQKIQGIILAD